jgi:hypothetical protein
MSHDTKSKLKAKGYLDIINLYRQQCNSNESEPVMISLVAESYIKTQEQVYNLIKKEEYRQKILAARECIVQYATSDEISVILSRLSFDDKSLTNYLNYLKGAGYMNRIRYNDLLSAYNLLVL